MELDLKIVGRPQYQLFFIKGGILLAISQDTEIVNMIWLRTVFIRFGWPPIEREAGFVSIEELQRWANLPTEMKQRDPRK